jgi:hypothetical protein
MNNIRIAKQLVSLARELVGAKPGIGTPSTKEMEQTIVEIMVDNGMSEKEAEGIVDDMSTREMKKYLEDARDN